jgi:hypothetical protein
MGMVVVKARLLCGPLLVFAAVVHAGDTTYSRTESVPKESLGERDGDKNVNAGARHSVTLGMAWLW